jgi:uncharacterized protein YecT (DUF1311 family)
MRRLLIVPSLLIGVILSATPCLAQTSTQFQACSKSAKTQLDLDECASAEITLRNKQMVSVYSAILSRVAGQPAALTKVKAMQGAWLGYVSTYLAALYPAANKQYEYGSIYMMNVALAQAALVQAHTRDLQELLANLKRYK